MRTPGGMLSLLAVGLLVLGMTTSAGWAAKIYVSPTGGGDGSIGNPTNLQAALNTAKANTENDTIYLQQGTYTGASTFSYETTGTDTHAVTLSGGWDADFSSQSTDNTLTILDGQSARRVLKVTGDGAGVNITFTIESLTIQNGMTTTYVAPPGDSGYGAGIMAVNYNSSRVKLFVRNCLVKNNNAASTYSAVGGGIWITCDYEIYDTIFSANYAYHYGGAIATQLAAPYTSSLAPIIDGCTFNANIAANAGGAQIMNWNASLIIRNSGFFGRPGGASSGGSGISSSTNSSLTISNSIFSGNVTNWWSGAIQFWNASGNITNTLFINNKAGYNGDGAGGVMDILWNSGPTAVVNITNCTFAGNRTLGFQISGGAITNRGSALTITNSIFWDNGGTAIDQESGSIAITYSDIQGGWSGTGNINSDPKFVGAGNYRLQKGSPCIDKGNNSAPGLPTTDLDGNVRKYDGDANGTAVVDMGAYEAQPVMGVSPESLQFGSVLIGTVVDKTVTVQNQGTLDLVLGTIGSPSSPFSKVPGSGACADSQTLTSGQNCTVTIQFQATPAGQYSSSFDIPSNDPNKSSVTVPLSGSAEYIVLVSPDDGYECTACSYYNLPTFQWNTNETFKTVVVQFNLHSDPTKVVKVKASATAKQLLMNSSSWKKILLLPGTGGGTVDWKVVGTEPDKAKTIRESPVYSMEVGLALPVGNPTISPTSKAGFPTLTWQNHCAVTFKAWFGSDASFTKKKALSFKVANPNDNGGVFTLQLSSSQWASLRKLVGDVAGSTIYWYVESWDVLKRYGKTDPLMSFVLNP